MADAENPRRWIGADPSPEEAARYVADLLTEALPLARRHRFRDLSYLLDLAIKEARDLAGQRKHGD